MSELVYRVTISGNPGDAAVNNRTRPVVRRGKGGGRGHASMVLTDEYRGWKERAVAVMLAAVASHPERGSLLDFREGPLEVSVVAYWPRRHKIGPAKGLPFGDVDAVSKACLDALGKPEPAKGRKPEKPGAYVITDDSQVMYAPPTKAYDKKNPRIEIEVRRHNG